MKNPRDYPLNEWLEMGDDCECGAPRKIKITGIQHDTLFVTKSVTHLPGCDNGWGLIHDDDIMAWEFDGRTVTFGGERYPVLSGHGNGVPCLKCWKLIDFPITLFLHEGKDGELTFCWACVQKYNMLKGFTAGGTYANFQAPRSK